MQLTRYTDYGLRVLIYLSVITEDRLVSIDEICETFDLSRNHVTKIVHHLGKTGWLYTKRGKSGGISLEVAPENINLADVVRELENTLESIDCDKPLCCLLGSCKLKSILSEAEKAYISTLEQYTIADLTTNSRKLKKIFDL